MPPEKVNIKTVGKSMNILIYGEVGSGKTTLAATAQDNPKMQDTLFLDFEGGLISIASRGDILRERIIDPSHLETIFYSLLAKDKGYETIKTIVIDSISEFQDKAIVQQAEKKGRGPDNIQIQDYGRNTKILQKLFRELRDSPLNVISIAFPKYFYPPGADENTPPDWVKPRLTQQLGESVAGYADFVWYLYTEEVKYKSKKTGKIKKRLERRLITTDTDINDYTTVRAKTRGANFSEAIGPLVKNPNIGELYDIFLESESPKKKGKKDAKKPV